MYKQRRGEVNASPLKPWPRGGESPVLYQSEKEKSKISVVIFEAAVLKMWSIEPQEFQRCLQGQNDFINNTKALSALFFCPVDMRTDTAKAIVDKNAGALAQIIGVARNHNLCGLHCNSLVRKRWGGVSQFHLTILNRTVFLSINFY